MIENVLKNVDDQVEKATEENDKVMFEQSGSGATRKTNLNQLALVGHEGWKEMTNKA